MRKFYRNTVFILIILSILTIIFLTYNHGTHHNHGLLDLLNYQSSLVIDFFSNHLLILYIFITFSWLCIIGYFVWCFILFSFDKKNLDMTHCKLEDYNLFVLVPCFNEKMVIENTIEKFFKKESIDISYHPNLVVIDDGSDDGSTELLKKIENKYENLHIVYRKLPNAQKGKGDALNEGVKYVKSIPSLDYEKTVIGILDADAYMSDEDYTKVVNTFNCHEDLTMLQTGIGMNSKRTWLERQQDVEFRSCMYLISNLRNHLKNVAAGGNGQFLRLSDIDKEKFWGNSLLEDFEVSIRILLQSKKTYYLDDATVYQEPVEKIRPLIVQRTRWAQGGIDCLFKYGRDILKSNNINLFSKVEMMFYMLLPFVTAIGALGHVFAIGVQIYYIFCYDINDYLMLAILIVGALLIAIILGLVYNDRTKYGTIKSFFFGLTIPYYSLLMVPVCYKAIARYILNKTNWDKTEHKNITTEVS